MRPGQWQNLDTYEEVPSVRHMTRDTDRTRTLKLARRLETWMQDGRDTVFLIGGADGLDSELKRRADDRIRLSSLTLPHGLARLLLCEQLYRAVSVLKNHPYHREG